MISLPILLSFAAVAFAGDTPIQSDSANQPSLLAKFQKASKSDVTGTITFEPATNGSVLVKVDVEGLPSSGGPFPYHIHQLPVPADGNCTGTKLHLNPYGGNENATTPQGKEAGDLSGRHGKIQGQSLSTEYVDNYISLNPNSKTYFGNLSVVIHYANTSRITCSNLTKLETSGSSGSNGTNSTSSSVETANAAGNMQAGGILAGALAGAAALLI
ncbi:SOD4 [Candida theae]|uniref:superoxide dismutase n=1 Tax=Candida theae TaxID=1198502 RepID=A0AAD5FXX2_9ASCO|nr:SOD4 [Candida theae]KAI5957516.1 SOD4 [Candida theae]